MNLILWILFGALVGWIGAIIEGKDEPKEAVRIIALGIIGGVGGGWIASIIDHEPLNNFSIYSVLAAVFAAWLILLLRQRGV